MSLIWKLLRQHISIPQFAGFFLANLVGMTIIFLGIQFYNDINAVYSSEDSFMREDYLIVNKEVSLVKSITGGNVGFSSDEINEIKKQDFVKKFGVFTPSNFMVRAGFDIQGLAHFSTDMFFEAVPDEFVDVDKEGWTFSPDDNTIPIIIPKTYLDLYNFGFAQSRNMPKMTEGVLEAIKIDITTRGNNDEQIYKGHIYGFSNRINTILVPQNFIDYANKRFSNDNDKTAARIIMQVDNPTDDNITKFLQDHNYVTDEDKLDASKTNYLLKIVLSIVLIIGLIICLLAFFILMLSIYLLVEKNSAKLQNLMIIGYSPAKVARPYQILTILLNLVVAVISVIIVFLMRKWYVRLFEDFFPDLEIPSFMPTWIMAIGICAFISVVNFFAIKRKVLSVWAKK